jgi:hypothetical protein
MRMIYEELRAPQVAVILTAAAEVMTSAKMAGRSLGLGKWLWTRRRDHCLKGVGYLGGISNVFFFFLMEKYLVIYCMIYIYTVYI